MTRMVSKPVFAFIFGVVAGFALDISHRLFSFTEAAYQMTIWLAASPFQGWLHEVFSYRADTIYDWVERLLLILPGIFVLGGLAGGLMSDTRHFRPFVYGSLINSLFLWMFIGWELSGMGFAGLAFHYPVTQNVEQELSVNAVQMSLFILLAFSMVALRKRAQLKRSRAMWR